MGKSAAPTLFVVGNQAAVKTWDDYCIDLKDTDVYEELSTDAFNLKDETARLRQWVIVMKVTELL